MNTWNTSFFIWLAVVVISIINVANSEPYNNAENEYRAQQKCELIMLQGLHNTASQYELHTWCNYDETRTFLDKKTLLD